jgi:SAM-dependent methyltransferase
MAHRPSWVPEDVDIEVPSPARMYDALLGGSHNFAVDRAAAKAATVLVPDLPAVAVSNRAFLRRVVGHLRDAGIHQFLDIGAGIPTVANTHELAGPDATVAYVDIDPVAVAHAQALLDGVPGAVALRGDLRDPAALLADERLRAVIDFDQPVAVLLIAVLHLLTDADQPAKAVAALRDEIVPGSYLAISHLSSARRPEAAAQLADHAARQSRVPITFRTREEITAFFDGLDLVDPGVVELPAWRPDTGDPADAARSLGLAGLGHRTSPAAGPRPHARLERVQP